MIAGTIATLERTGARVISWITGIFSACMIVGSCLAWCTTGWIYGRPVKLSAIALQLVETGLRSLPLIALFAVSIGVILSIEMVHFLGGADFLPTTLSFIGRFSIREEAPLLAGIILAARVGGALSSELSSMAHNKELTALNAMGIDPIRFLIAPAFVALLIAAPLITALLAAGELITISIYLFFAKGVQPLFSLGLSISGISGLDLTVGLIKGLCFGATVLGISTYLGLNALSLKRSIGSVTTYSIVASITVVLLVNVIITLVAPD